MAAGAWAKMLVGATIVQHAFASDESEPMDMDPFRLFGESEESDIMPYTPAVLEKLSECGKVN
jgi:hypothetical protein